MTWEELQAEYYESRIGPKIWGLIRELTGSIAKRYPPRVYNDGAPWSDDGVDDLAQQVVLDRLLGEAQLEYLFDQATSIDSWRRLLTLQIRRTLAHRRRKTVVDRLLSRLRGIARTPPFQTRTVGTAIWISREGADSPLVDLPDHQVWQLAGSLHDIPQLMASPRSSHTSMIYTTADLRLLLERVVEQVGVVSERDLARILEILLTSWLPTFLQDPERDYPFDQPSPETVAEATGTISALRTFADGLSNEERWIVLSKSQGIADREIASRLGRSRPWVAERKQRVLQRLGTELMSQLDEEHHLPAMEKLLALISESLGDGDS